MRAPVGATPEDSAADPPRLVVLPGVTVPKNTSHRHYQSSAQPNGVKSATFANACSSKYNQYLPKPAGTVLDQFNCFNFPE